MNTNRMCIQRYRNLLVLYRLAAVAKAAEETEWFTVLFWFTAYTPPPEGRASPAVYSETGAPVITGAAGTRKEINLHLYHYAGNNPVKFIDPDGNIVITVGLAGNAHMGLGIQGSIGIAIGLSKEEGFDLGVYANGGVIGSGPLPSAGLGITLGLNLEAKEIHDIDGVSSSMGGGIGPISIDIGTNEGGEPDFVGSGGNLTVGAKSTPSGHVSLETTGTATLKDLGNNALKGMSKAKKALDQYVFDNIVKQIFVLSQ
jgi:hypothetical protein